MAKMSCKVIFGHTKWASTAIFKPILNGIYLKWREMRKKLFQLIQNGHQRPFCEKKFRWYLF